MSATRLVYGRLLPWTSSGRRTWDVEYAGRQYTVGYLPASGPHRRGWYLRLGAYPQDPWCGPWWVGDTIAQAKVCAELKLICPDIGPDGPDGPVPAISTLMRGVPIVRGTLLVRPVEWAHRVPVVLSVARQRSDRLGRPMLDPVTARIHAMVDSCGPRTVPVAQWRAVIPGVVDVWCDRWDQAWTTIAGALLEA